MTVPALDLFACARDADPVTSHAGADAIKGRRQTRAETLLATYRQFPGGLTDEQAGELSGVPGAWKRCSDLRRAGLIVPTGATRPTHGGGIGMVCRVAP